MTQKIAIIECVATILSLIISLIALFKSHQQIKLSNKQNLLNNRIKSYLIISGLLKLYESNKELIEEEKKDEIFFSSDMVLTFLINNSYLEIMSNVIKKPLHQPEQKEFLRKIEELENEALKTKFIFDEVNAEKLSFFIKEYSELLMELYQYIVLIDSMRTIQEQNPIKDDIHKIAEEVNEKECREKLYNQFKNLTVSYNVLKKDSVMNQIEKEIKMQKYL